MTCTSPLTLPAIWKQVVKIEIGLNVAHLHCIKQRLLIVQSTMSRQFAPKNTLQAHMAGFAAVKSALADVQ